MTTIKDLTGALRPICDIEIDGVDQRDRPDFSDAYISDATWADTGEPLTEDELHSAGEQLGELINERAQEIA